MQTATQRPQLMIDYQNAVEDFYLAQWMRQGDEAVTAAQERYATLYHEATRAYSIDEVDTIWRHGRNAAERTAIQLGYTLF